MTLKLAKHLLLKGGYLSLSTGDEDEVVNVGEDDIAGVINKDTRITLLG
jgi:hypothetical protein